MYEIALREELFMHHPPRTRELNTKTTLLSLLLFISAFLIGCSPLPDRYGYNSVSTVEQDMKLLNEYKIRCDKSIAENSYHPACDLYLDLSDKYIDSSDISTVEKRGRYMQLKKDDEQRRQQLQIAEKKRIQDEKYSPTTLSSHDDRSLCMRFYFGVDDKVLTGNTAYDKNIEAELKKRGFKQKHIDLARQGNVTLKMPVCMMYAAIGTPKSENRTVGSYGVHIQHVYSSRFYIYSENGVVTSWQD